jgi:hypothetical protein
LGFFTFSKNHNELFKSSPNGVKSPNLVTLTQSHAEVKEKATCFKFIFCQKVFVCFKCIAGNGKNFQMKIWSQWYKNTAVNYRGNFNPIFLGLKYRSILLPL